MGDEVAKFKLIKKVVEDYFYFLRDKPRLLGSIKEIETNFVLLDQLNFIVKYNTKFDKKEHSWISFLAFKNLITGKNTSISEKIEKEKDPFAVLSKLRDEYDEWLDIKMGYSADPKDDRLLKLLENTSKIGAEALLSWFIRYPSKRAINLYSNRIKGNYFDNPDIAMGLSIMGDVKVFSWAIDQIDKSNSFNKRRLILKCVACSPIQEAYEIIHKIIQDMKPGDIDQLDDIECIAGVLGRSASNYKYKLLEQIISKLKKNPTLKTILELSIRSLIDEDQEQALRLLNMLGKGYDH